MNITEEQLIESGYSEHFYTNQRVFELLFGASESLFSFDTYQLTDYSKVGADRFDSELKAKGVTECIQRTLIKPLK
jgi:hypothetical protein